MTVATTSPARVANADSGEAAFGTPTQALQAAISLGDRHTCVISNTNLLCWGDNTSGQLGNGFSGVAINNRPTYVKDSLNSNTNLSGVVAVVAATNHTCALINNGKVKCWGEGWRTGQFATSGAARPWPAYVKNAYTSQTESDASGDLTNVIGLTAATYNSCALISDGRVKCWGDGTGNGGKPYNGVGYVLQCSNDSISSSCGTGATNNQPITGIKQINMSGQTGCAIKQDTLGSQVCWGSDNGPYGYATAASGDRMYASSADPSVNGAKALGSGIYTGCGLFEKVSGQAIAISGGQVKCWGKNGSKALGRGDGLPEGTGTSYVAENVPGLDTAMAISSEGSTMCSLLFNRTVKCWGDNQNGRASTGVAVAAQGTPLSMKVGNSSSADITDIYAVSVGGSHVCIITGLSGNVKCSGSNANGQLGDGSVTASASVVSVRDATGSGTGTLEGAGADNMPPTFASAEVNVTGTTIILSYNELISSSGVISPSQFVVKVGNTPKTVSSVTVNGQTVELSMAERIGQGAEVLLKYTDVTGGDDSNVIEDVSFNDASSFSDVSVNNLSVTEAVSPTLVSAAVNAAGTGLTLTFNEALGATTAAASAFAVTVGGVSRTVTGTAVSGLTVVLTLSSAALAGSVVTVAYTAPSADLGTSNNAVQDSAGNDAASFSSSAVDVVNNSTFDNVSPTFLSAAVSGDKTKVVLTYNETLGAATAATGAFVVTVATVSRGVTGVAVVGATVELTLASAVSPGQAVTVGYTDPTAGNDASAVQDLTGNDAATFAATSVTNIEDTTAPTFVSGAVNSIGSLVLTYSETLGTNGPSASTVTVQINGVTVTVSSVTILNATVVVVTSPVIGVGDTVTFSYVKPTAGNDVFAIQDAAGNDVASSSSAYSVPSGSNNSVVDTAKPTLTSGAVATDGKLVLTYNETLGTPGPLASQVTVTVNGETVVVTGVVVSGSTVVITTNPPIETGDVVTYSYTDPTAGNDAAAIQDAAGNDVATSGTAYSVPGGSNASTIDTRQPAFVGGAVSGGGTLVLTYSEPLDGDGPSTSSIVVTINGVEVTVTDVAVIGSTIVVTTSPLIGPDDVVTYKYVDPSTGNDSEAIQDSAGNDIATSNTPYALPANGNGSTVDKVKPAAPTDVSINTGGDKITMVFPEDMSGTKPAGSDFTVTVDGVVYTVTGVEISGKDVVLIVSPSIKTGQTVTIGYKDPSTGNDGNALQDAAGNDVSSFSGAKVENKSVQVSAVNQVDGVLDSTLPLDKASVDATKVVDGDAASTSTSMSETKTVSGKSGTAKFSDGSSFAVSKNGNLIPKLFTAYIGTVTGSVKVTYKVGKKTTSVTCSYGKYGSTKPKKVTKSQNGWYPKAFISPKKSCKMPVAAVKALNTQMVTIAANLKFVRLWPTTGKPKNPESGAAVRPVKRSYSVKIGTEPK